MSDRKDLNAYLNKKQNSAQFSLDTNTEALNYGEDVNNRDYLDDGFTFMSDYNVQELRANRQPWIHKAARGTARVATKTLAELAKMPGVAGGIIAGAIGQVKDVISGEDNTDFMQTAFNNAWIQSIEKTEKEINTEGLPVYVEKAVRDGNLWDKITSVDFWATEGADGLGYVISMLAPGAAITSLKIGSKMTGINKLAKMAKSTEAATSNLTKLGITANNIDVGLAGLANTVFEAGAEARGAMDGYRQALEHKLSLPDGDPEKISQEEYTKMLGEESAIGAKVFGANAGILLGPNLIMAKLLWGKTRNKLPNFPKGKFDAVPTPSIAKRIGNWGDEFGKATLREGFWEEGMQSTAEKYFTENPTSGMGDFLSDVDTAYFENLGTTEGQTAIFLGAVYGGTMQATINSYKAKGERENTNKLIAHGNKLLGDFGVLISDNDVYQKDEEGNDVYQKNEKTGELERQIDPIKLVQKMESNDKLDKLSTLYDVAKGTNNKDMMEEIENKIYTDLVKGFIVNDNLGVEALRIALKSNADVAKATEGADIDVDTITEAIIKKAQYLKTKYNSFSEFAPSLIKLQSKEATDSDYNNFFQILTSKYLDSHSRLQFLEGKKEEKEALLQEVLSERGNTLEDIEGDNTLKSKEILQSSRVDKLYREAKTAERAIEEVKKELEQYWEEDKYNEAFEKYVKEARELEAKLAKEAEYEDKLNEIKNASSKESLDAITLFEGDTDTNEVLEAAREKRRDELDAITKGEVANAQAAAESSKTAAEKKAELEAAQLDKLKANYNVGEIITTPDWVKDHGGETATITKIGKKSITVTNETGESYIISMKSLLKNEVTATETTNVEGNLETNSISEETREANKEHDHKVEDRNDSVVMTTNAAEAHELFPGIDPAALEFERNPVNKTGKLVRFEVDQKEDKSRGREISTLWAEIRAIEKELASIDVEQAKKEIKSLNRRLKLSKKEATIANLNKLKAKEQAKLDRVAELTTGNTTVDTIKAKIEEVKKDIADNPKTLDITFTENQEAALQMFLEEDFSDIEFLIKYLPLNAKLTSSVSAPLHTRSDSKGAGKFNKIWEASTKNLRTAIIKEMAIEGTPINKISVEIVGQKNGDVTMAPKVDNKVVENAVHELHQFAGDITKIKTSDIFIVNKLGVLENNNTKAEKVHLNRPLAPGEVYIRIATANGSPFYLKLNIRKTTEEEADLLYEIYKYRFQEEEAGKSIAISDTTPELFAKMQENFAEPLRLIGKPVEDITIKDVVDFFIWDGAKSRKSQVRFYTKEDKRLLFVGAEEFTAEQFATDKGKEDFIYTLTEIKRHNIRFKRRKGATADDVYTKTLRNKDYLQYLIRNKILNTNAVVGEPTFQGATNIYLQSFRVKANNRLSKHNVGAPKSYSKKLRGKNAILKKIFPKVGENFVRLSTNQKGYVDSNGNFHYRVSTLKGKGKPTEAKQQNAAKRGNVVDELTRIFFSYPVNINEFKKKGQDIVDKENKKDGMNLTFDPIFFEQLYNVLDQYAAEFEKKNYTIYSNIPSVAGKFGEGKSNMFGGTVDLLAYDHDQGHYVLIDLKTTSTDRSGYYTNSKDPYNYKSGDRIQLNAYRELLKQKMGIEVEEIFIMPLTVKALDSNNTMYRDVSIDSKGMFLPVDMSKSIYDLHRFKTPGEKATGRFNMTGATNDIVFDPSKDIDAKEMEGKKWDTSKLMDLAVELANLASTKSEPTPVAQASNDKVDPLVEKIITRFTKNSDASDYNFEGKYYKIAGDVGYIVETDSTFKKINDIIIDKDLALNILKGWNKVFGKMPLLSFDEDSFMTKYNNNFFNKTISIQEKVKRVVEAPTNKKGIDLSSVPDSELDKINLVLADFLNANNQKGFQALMSKNLNKSLREKVELFMNFLIDRKVSVEDIRKKCGL
tara:strand:+ start:3890 stop:9604 length:5715 start_codon:yes stop_codon:yes gene_type:complete